MVFIRSEDPIQNNILRRTLKTINNLVTSLGRGREKMKCAFMSFFF